ncbi:MAG: tRNA uridine-5-carboxymethylaminomethyl(34) synthesis GTPase MnmE [Candidatus Muiribacteriota bacterium]|jgi:tRNA modification GTPase
MREFVHTIAAPATSPAGSAISIIRISGEKSLEIINLMTDTKIKKPNQMYLRNIFDNNKNIIDKALVVFFKKPLSYTGEDMAEIHCHGGFTAYSRIYSTILEYGARAATKGEFTRRAFLNGKLDLAQAEGVNSLINATNNMLADNSLKIMDGIFSRKIKEIREEIIELNAYVEAYIDFPDDEVEEITGDFLKIRVEKFLNQIKKIKNSYNIFKKLSDGIKIVIIGRPNTGKSSLLNAVLREERAIVTEIEGTTRDILREKTQINGITVSFIDTAGLRNSEDIIETEGIKRTRENAEKADFIIFMLDGAKNLTEEDKDIYQSIKDRKKLILINKADVGSKISEKDFPGENVINISLKTGFNYDRFEEFINNNICLENFCENENIEFFIDNERYVSALSKVEKSLENILNTYQNTPLEYVAEDFREALNILSEIIGEVYTDDILDKIFSTFCIGK